MKKNNLPILLILVVFLIQSNVTTGQSSKTSDWLLDSSSNIAQISLEGKDITLSNGLILRKIRISPNAATVEFKNLTTGETMLRSIKPEAEVAINDSIYEIGGLHGLKEHGYLQEEWLNELSSNSSGFQYLKHWTEPIRPKLNWNNKKRFNTSSTTHASGKKLTLQFTHASTSLENILVNVHYEIYDGLPLIAKWISVQNNSDLPIVIKGFKSEILAFPEVENPVETPRSWRKPNLHVESNYAFGGFTSRESNSTTFWESDPEYTSQVNWKMETPCLLVSKLAVGPNLKLPPSESFESFQTYELLLDGTDRERNGLSKRKMYRMLAPWATENPIFMHLTTTDPNKVKAAIDQCVATGYEMVILSFGSGLNMEDNSEQNIKKFRRLADYAHKRGIELGGYSLFSSRKINDSIDVIDKDTGKPGGAKFGNAPCLASEWGFEYLRKLKYFFEQTGFDLLEHDGPYPGDYCASTQHKYHRGYEDSQWAQWNMTRNFYHWLKEKDIYLNAPDFYFLEGSNKCGIGYREVNWSLPRDQQLVLGRQNIFDGTWEKSPSMAWTFVPLTEYHGGGEAATLEPLEEHLDAYEAHMAQNYGSGVQACYRGPRLFDSEITKKLVQEQILHYKKYREILNSDIIHLRRPDGRSWDGFLHVNPKLKQKGLLMLFNPTSKFIETKVSIPLYYTGLTEQAILAEKGNEPKVYSLNRKFELVTDVKIPANGYNWFTIE